MKTFLQNTTRYAGKFCSNEVHVCSYGTNFPKLLNVKSFFFILFNVVLGRKKSGNLKLPKGSKYKNYFFIWLIIQLRFSCWNFPILFDDLEAGEGGEKWYVSYARFFSKGREVSLQPYFLRLLAQNMILNENDVYPNKIFATDKSWFLNGIFLSRNT